MRAIGPVHILLIHQADVGFVYQGSGLKCVVFSFPAHVTTGQPVDAAQFVTRFLTILLIGVAPVLAQTPGDLPALAPVERELKGGETQSFRIVLAANQFLHALVEQKDIDVMTAARILGELLIKPRSRHVPVARHCIF